MEKGKNMTKFDVRSALKSVMPDQTKHNGRLAIARRLFRAMCAQYGSTDHFVRWRWTRPCNLPAAIYDNTAGQKLGYFYFEEEPGRGRDGEDAHQG